MRNLPTSIYAIAVLCIAVLVGCESSAPSKIRKLRLIRVAVEDFQAGGDYFPAESGNKTYWSTVLGRDSVNWRGVLLQRIVAIGSHSPNRSQHERKESLIASGREWFEDSGLRIYANFDAISISDRSKKSTTFIMCAFLHPPPNTNWWDDDNAVFSDLVKDTCASNPNESVFVLLSDGTIGYFRAKDFSAVNPLLLSSSSSIEVRTAMNYVHNKEVRDPEPAPPKNE